MFNIILFKANKISPVSVQVDCDKSYSVQIYIQHDNSIDDNSRTNKWSIKHDIKSYKRYGAQLNKTRK